MADISYKVKIRDFHRSLGIAENYADTCGMALQEECQQLVSAGPDVFGRDTELDREALAAWRSMQATAAEAGVILQLVSGFRSAEYQYGIFQRKLGRGQALDEILKVNAAPGFSEHHSGCAIDIGTPGVEHLSEEFENSKAFAWLGQHAGDFGFSLSFPRNNPYNILYEPWHWKYIQVKSL